MRVSNVAAKAMCDALTALVNAGGAGSFRFYTGSAPTNVEDAATGTLLANLAMSSTAFGSAVDANPGATATANTISDDTDADATGSAGYFRVLSGAGTAIFQGSCGTSGADVNFNTVAISQHGIVSVSSFTVTVPET